MTRQIHISEMDLFIDCEVDGEDVTINSVLPVYLKGDLYNLLHTDEEDIQQAVLKQVESERESIREDRNMESYYERKYA